jgi:hypothetical protein
MDLGDMRITYLSALVLSVEDLLPRGTSWADARSARRS